ncbi:bifunctional shikimate kinase/3-dehydroquinate synthase [Microbacterium kribbense]|uniref:Shikimate kinase n=1 Tax=Microbacterium kribbense TaxID=433645 RepID=A0ABP7G7J1_9MICO
MSRTPACLRQALIGIRFFTRIYMLMVVLIGFMGAGKSTVGRIVADLLGVSFVDTDVFIERHEGRTIREMFDLHGEAYFRQIERAAVTELLEDRASVLALGGGAPMDREIRALLGGHTVVYLHVPYEQALVRVHGDSYRPLLHGSGVRQIYDSRMPVYESTATIRVETDGRRPDDVAREVLHRLAPTPNLRDGSSCLVTAVGGTYFAHAGPGVTARAVDLIPNAAAAESVVIISATQDEQISDSIASQLDGHSVIRATVDDHERSKSFSTVARLAEQMATQMVHRNDLVIGVGGEVVCEIAGLVAALFNRGIPLALVPTTLVAQADSAIGGKNAISLPQGRNLIGTIYQPVAVVADTAVAARKDQRGYSAGLAEIVKHALLQGTDAVNAVMSLAGALRGRDPAAVNQAVRVSQEFKAAVVSRDDRETGDRVFLNYGHTFAHAIEWATGVDGSDDGAPIAIGMMAAAHVSHIQGRMSAAEVEVHRDLLVALGLPTSATVDVDRLEAAWMRDKKYDHGVRLVLLDRIGVPRRGCTATREELATALAALAPG